MDTAKYKHLMTQVAAGNENATGLPQQLRPYRDLARIIGGCLMNPRPLSNEGLASLLPARC